MSVKEKNLYYNSEGNNTSIARMTSLVMNCHLVLIRAHESPRHPLIEKVARVNHRHAMTKPTLSVLPSVTSPVSNDLSPQS